MQARWGPGVMQLDRVWEMWVHMPPSLCWTQQRGWHREAVSSWPECAVMADGV